ncbi:MAG: aminotransferase class V-fold PLP-dependent enzyme, partial [Gemmatimonas sp.]
MMRREALAGDAAAMEFTPEQMLHMGRDVVARSVQHLAEIGQQPSCGDVDVVDLCRSLRESAPEAGTDLEPLLDLLFNELIPRSFTTPGPGYLAYIPGGGVYPAALADFIADTTNRYTGVWQAAPALVQLEANVLEWLRDWMGFPTGTAGLLTTGGSGATFNAIVCARERHLGADIRSGTLYTSSQAHHSISKAAKLAGIAADRVRTIGVDRDYRMDVAELSAAIAKDRAQGLHPFLVVSTAGTTNTGAVDPLDDIADVCARQSLWHHVDGAYGAFFHMCPALRDLLPGLSRADSLTLDPHKGMFLPYGTGALLVRDGNALRLVHSATAGYLPENQDEFYDPAQYGPELSRGFPGLRVWLSVKLYGAARYRAAIAEKRHLAVWAADRVARISGVVMDAAPQLSLFAFHLEGPSLSTQASR